MQNQNWDARGGWIVTCEKMRDSHTHVLVNLINIFCGINVITKCNCMPFLLQYDECVT